jgi:tetratricopeptide (TPR) repeat protein
MRSRRKQHELESTVTGEPDPAGLQSLIANGHVAKCVREARALAKAAGSDRRRRISYSIREIECQRRRAARDALDEAARRYAEIESDAQACPDLLPRLYYEGGYVRLLLGHHRAAKELFEESVRCAGDSPIEYAIAASAVVECVVAINGIDSPWDQLFECVDQAEGVLRAADSIHAQQWTIDNWSWDRVRMAIIRGDAEGARRLLDRAETHFKNQTALAGWSTGSLAKRLALRGSVTLVNGGSEADFHGAARLLTRSVVVLVGRRRQYPERLLDALYDLATALEHLGASRHTDLPLRLRAIAGRTRDGSSWSHPYRED